MAVMSSRDCARFRTAADSVWMFLQISGDVQQREDGGEVLAWQHSNAKVYVPKKKYNPAAEFMSFEHYNVEIRDRVKVISGIEGQVSWFRVVLKWSC